MIRLAFAFCALGALAACSAGSGQGPIPPQQLQGRAFVDNGPPTITVFTMISNSTGSGGHSSLMVSGSQRVLFDPAGSFVHEDAIEFGDVLYGMSDVWVRAYKSAHARDSHHVVSQEFVVSPQVAERALQLVQANGSVSSAFCANSTTSILRQLPGFEDTKVTFFPKRLMEQLAQKPGVVTTRLFENDAGDVLDGIAAQIASQ